MKIAKQIRIQKLQNKNRMVGQTFNPSGHTSQSLDLREKQEVERIKSLSDEEFIKLGDNYKAIETHKYNNNIFISNSFEQNVFHRNFDFRYNEMKKHNPVTGQIKLF